MIYIDKVCFLLEKSYRQGYQWVSGSPIYKKEDHDWGEIGSPVELSQVVLQQTLSNEAYAHPGVVNLAAIMESLSEI